MPQTTSALMMRFHTHSDEETRSTGRRIGSHLRKGDVILLFGDLGAGKTTLTQGISAGLGAGPDHYVRSPTFTLINQYDTPTPIFHLDLYRLDSLDEIESLGLEELFQQGDGIYIVEWAEKLFEPSGGALPPDLGIDSYIRITLKFTSEVSREIEINTQNLADKEHPVFSLQ